VVFEVPEGGVEVPEATVRVDDVFLADVDAWVADPDASGADDVALLAGVAVLLGADVLAGEAVFLVAVFLVAVFLVDAEAFFVGVVALVDGADAVAAVSAADAGLSAAVFRVVGDRLVVDALRGVARFRPVAAFRPVELADWSAAALVRGDRVLPFAAPASDAAYEAAEPASASAIWARISSAMMPRASTRAWARSRFTLALAS